ncbi:MAG: tRNA(Ile)-lysidine synthetase, partial [Candidatus Krumholzibacteriota bacterium]|nr:tRNA(Ile)-lysidine synthetase [Candidatus Krumholzibacteriota bacterium]
MSSGRIDTADRFAQAVKNFVVAHGLVSRGSRVLVAVSGGADSMALLTVLHRLSGELGISLAVGHFNHRLRESAGDELECVREYAASLRLPFHSGAGDVRAMVDSTGDSVEEAGRKARYRFLERTAEDIEADRIATGHTRCDHTETVLMRMLRGTGLRGLAGIPVRRGKIVRPLRDLTHENTVSYCRALSIPYAEDPSNADLRFFRNRVRHELLPLLRMRYDDRIDDNLAKLAANAQSVVGKIRIETKPLIEKYFSQTSPDTWVLETSDIARLDETTLIVLFGDLFAEKLSCDMDFTRVHYEGLVRLVGDARASGKSLSLPGLTVWREHGKLVITRRTADRREAHPRMPPRDLCLPGETIIPGLVVTTELLQRSAVGRGFPKSTEEEAYFDAGRLIPPLSLRHPVTGDRMQPFGMGGTKKLSDIFIDKKIPAGERPTSLVIADAHDIIWLVGVATSEKCRVRNDTREIVRIRV